VSSRPPISRRLDVVARDAFDLPRRDQLALFAQLRAYLGDEDLGREDPHDTQIEAQKLVIECLERAAVYHKLNVATEVLTAAHYREAKRALDLPLGLTQVIRVCGRWRAAQAIVRGNWIPETARQQRLRARLYRRRRSDADYLDGPRAFLATAPRPAGVRAYDAWVREQRQKGTMWPGSATIRKQLGRPWSEILAAAPSGQFPALDEQTLPEFIPAATAARILGLTDATLLKNPTYPTHVLMGGNAVLYLSEDILAFREGRPVPKRNAASYQARYLRADELAQMLGFSNPESVYQLLSRKLYHLIPKPSIRVPGVAVLWLRSDVERFIPQREARGAALRVRNRPGASR
jgi:predicted DNA-binding transcriptional regulator AlpA